MMKKVIDRMNASIEEQAAFRKGSIVTEKDEEETEGLRVDFYLVVFLKFIGSVIPTIDVDTTTAI